MELFKDKKYIDAYLKVYDKYLGVHRCILAIGLPFFDTLFQTKMNNYREMKDGKPVYDFTEAVDSMEI